MHGSRGFLRKTLLIACAIAVAVAFVLPATDASAFSQPIPTKISLLKWGGNPRVGKLYKIVSKPTSPSLFPLPPVGTGPDVNGGSLLVTVGAGQVTCDLSNTANWKGLGKPAGSKGYKYVNKSAPVGDLCKVVIVKEKVIKVLAKGVGTVALPGDPGENPDVQMELSVGLDTYCAEATGPHFKEKAETLIKMKDEPAPALCCDCTGLTSYSFTTGLPTGATGGTLSNFRCSNYLSGACVDDADCDYGTCLITPPVCAGNTSVGCTQDSDCSGGCAENVAGNLPLALSTASLYTGGGLNSVPLPLPVPDKGKAVYAVSGSESLTLSATGPADVGQRNCTKGRTCLDGTTPCVVDSDCPSTCVDNCIFGPPVPIPNSGTPATSVCAINVVADDASGTGQCDGGDIDVNVSLRSVVYLNGDLFKSSTPPDIPNVQPCPLCDTLCQGGSKDSYPCDDDTDCPDGGSCGGSPECLGGPNEGDPCTPGTSDSAALGDPENAYPTSLDCQNDPLQNITANIGGLPISLNMTTGSRIVNAVDRPNGDRVFCGFCRDVAGAGSFAFEGDTAGGLPPAIPPADGNAVPCTSDAECADGDEYESCVQRNPGAFAEAAATRIEMSGSTDGACLDDGNPHPQTQVSIFCIPPTFDPTVDAAGDLPGPGGSLLVGDAALSPSGAFINMGMDVLD